MAAISIDGTTLRLPIEVRKARNWVANYMVPAAPARPLLAPTGLTLAEPRPGKALLTLGFVEYEDSDLGPYHEFMVTLLVRLHGAPPATARRRAAEVRKSRVGVYIHRLPVDSKFSLDAGRTIWGYPKTLASFERTRDGLGTTWVLRREGEPMVRMRFSAPWFPMPRPPAPPTYTILDGTVRMTPWETRSKDVKGRPGGVRLTLGTGALADELRSLGLPKRALLSMRVGHLRARFFAAQPIGGGPASVSSGSPAGEPPVEQPGQKESADARENT